MFFTKDKIISYSFLLGAVLAATLIIFVITQIWATIVQNHSFEPYTNTISVDASSEVFAVPDVAVFSFTVSSVGNTVEIAQQDITKVVEQALEAIEDADVEEEDIKTTSFNVYPEYEWTRCPAGVFDCISERVEKGFRASQTTRVKVRDMDKAGELLSTVSKFDIDNVSGLSFEVDDIDEYKEQAREEAIEKAKDKAKVLADQLGVKLGKVVSFYDNQSPFYGYDTFAEPAMVKSFAEESSIDAVVNPGESAIVSNVTITFELK